MESFSSEHWLERFVSLYFVPYLSADITILIITSVISCCIQIFGSIGSVGGGLALGKEGPLVHTGACIASLFGQV